MAHSGWVVGFTSNISRFVKDDVCVIVLSNNESNAEGITDDLASILFDIPLYQQPKEVTINSTLLDRYVGKYILPNGLVIEHFKKDDKLYGRIDGSFEDLELKPESEKKFFLAVSPKDVTEFEVDAAGKVTKAWVCKKGVRTDELKKVE